MDGVAWAIAFEQPVERVFHIAAAAMHGEVGGFVDDHHAVIFVEPTDIFVDGRINAHAEVLQGQAWRRQLHRAGRGLRQRGRANRR